MRNTNSRLRDTAAWTLLIIGFSFSTTARAGQGVWTSGGPYGGDIRALAIDPVNPASVYAGTPSGVFKSSNSGESWAAVNMGLTDEYVNALAIDPATPATLYAGVDSGVLKSIDSGRTWAAANSGPMIPAVSALAINPMTPATLYAGTFGGGVFKSTDSGASWTAANTGLTNLGVYSLAIDPATPETLYAAGTGGVFRSNDSGGTWAAANVGLPYVAWDDNSVSGLIIDPSTPATLYVLTNSGVFKSLNSAGSWEAANTGLTDGASALAIDPSTPTTLYAAGNGAVFKSTDAGGTWVTIHRETTNFWTLAINPLAPATLYAAGDGVLKSTDSGGTWVHLNTGLTNVDVLALAINPTTPAILYAGTDGGGGGVLKSTDSGGTWAAASTGLSGLPYVLAIDPTTPTTLCTGTNGSGLFKSTDSAGTWTAANTGLTNLVVQALAIDPTTPATLYAGTLGGGVFKSTDSGASWAATNTGLTNAYFSALAVDPSSPTTLYAGTYDPGGVFKSTDSGTSWVPKGLTGQNVFVLAIDPSTSATLYAGTYNGGVFKSVDSGDTWAAANTGLTGMHVTALAINPAAPTTLYAAIWGNGVFRSTNSGGTWAAVNAGLLNLNVKTLALDPTGATTLYAGIYDGSVWQLTAPTAGTVTALLPASAHAKGANGAFYTTDVSIANTGHTPASFALKFLGHDQDGSGGAEQIFNLGPGTSTTFSDVLGSVFGQTNNFGAIRVTSNSSTLDIDTMTSTPGFGGALGQTIPAVPFADLIPAGSSRSILYIREGDGFRTNLILASGSSVSTDVDVALVSPAGATLAKKTYAVLPNGMIQVNRVVRDMGVSGVITGARLVLSSSTAGAFFTGLASVIDETTNDPTAISAQAASVSGSSPYTWLLPSSVHSSGINGAFYKTNLAVANVGLAPGSFTMKFLGHDQDGSDGPEQTFTLEAGKSVVYFDVLGQVFGQTSDFGAIRITSDTHSFDIVSVTSTPGFGGTLSQTIPAVASTDLIPAGSQRSILHIREGDGFRSNLVLASDADVSTAVDVALVSPEGATLAAKSYSVPPNGMTQIDHIVRDMGVSGAISGARLVVSSTTTGAAFAALATVIDETTNDSTAVEAR